MQETVQVTDPKRAKAFFEDKMTFTTGPIELERMLNQNEDIVVVDVRATEDYRDGHIPGAINIPHEEWNHPQGLHQDKVNVLYCYSHVCHLAAKAAVQFAGMGYPVMEMDGGFRAWHKHDLRIER